GWLEADHSAKGCWFSNRAGSIGADGAVTYPRSDGSCRTSGRSPGDAFNVPRIADLTVVADDRAAAVSEFVQVLFAQQDRAGGFQAADDFSVFFWNSIFKKSAGRGGTDSGGINQVFKCEWNAVQRAPPVAAPDFVFRQARLFQ